MADLAEIKRRLALGRVTMDDAEALVAEVDRLRAAILGAEDSVVSPQLTGDEVLDDLERLEREATEAPWEADDDERPSVWGRSGTIVVGDFNYASDEALIVATRNALPGLIAEIRISRLALANVRMYAAIKIRKTDPESAEHLLRLCAEAGVTGSVVRGEGAS